jgi:hypothetical protein
MLFFLIGRVSATASPSLGFDPKVLLREYQQAQQSQLKEVQSREKGDLKSLLKAQALKQKDFDRREREARRGFFAADHPGPEKRAYMKDLIARREALKKELSEERIRAKELSDKKIKALLEDQKLKLGKFKEAVKNGQRPPEELWPQPGV